MAKYKAKEFIPQWDSHKGLRKEDWEALNNGKSVELESVPAAAEEYLQPAKSSKSNKESE